MTPIEWLIGQLEAPCRGIPSHIIEEARRMEEEREYEMKCYWFGRGINAAKTNGIGKLKPKRNEE